MEDGLIAGRIWKLDQSFVQEDGLQETQDETRSGTNTKFNVASKEEISTHVRLLPVCRSLAVRYFCC